MSIIKSIISQNVVLVSQNINTTAFTQYWFIKNKIFSEEQILSGSIFIPGFTNVVTKDCELSILPDKVQIILKSDEENIRSWIVDVVIKSFVEKSMLPIMAIGLNTIWSIYDPEGNIHELSKRLFYNGNTPISGEFCQDDTLYGTYFSKSIDDVTKLKLDIKPVKGKIEGLERVFLTASFNFHSDYMPQFSHCEYAINQLSKFQNFAKISDQIICLLN